MYCAITCVYVCVLWLWSESVCACACVCVWNHDFEGKDRFNVKSDDDVKERRDNSLIGTEVELRKFRKNFEKISKKTSNTFSQLRFLPCKLYAQRHQGRKSKNYLRHLCMFFKYKWVVLFIKKIIGNYPVFWSIDNLNLIWCFDFSLIFATSFKSDRKLSYRFFTKIESKSMIYSEWGSNFLSHPL